MITQLILGGFTPFSQEFFLNFFLSCIAWYLVYLRKMKSFPFQTVYMSIFSN